MKQVLTKADLNEVRSQERAFLFLWVVWSCSARHSEVALKKLVKSWSNEYPDKPAHAYRVDVSDEKGGGWDVIREWIRSEVHPQVLSLFGGNGELLWLHAGKVSAVVPHIARIEHDTLMATTRMAFGV